MHSDTLVFCCICGIPRDPRNPAVSYRSLDRKWWCTDETECTDRAARLSVVMAMEAAALDAELEAGNWGLR